MALKNNKISFIVPAHNVAEYLDECAESILAQTYENIELVLVENGSSDNTPEICRKWAKKDKRVRAVFAGDLGGSGASLARKIGAEKSTGEYIAFVDGDDTVKNYFAEIMMGALAKSGADIATSLFYRNEKYDEERLRQHRRFGNAVKGRQDNLRDFLVGDFHWTMPTLYPKLFKRELLSAILWPEYNIAEDQVVALSLYAKANKSVFLAEEMCFYRKHGKSETQNFKPEWITTVPEFVDDINAVMKKYGQEDLPELQKYLGRALIRTIALLAKHRIADEDKMYDTLRAKLAEVDTGYSKKAAFYKFAFARVSLKTIRFMMNAKYGILFWRKRDEK
jgi:glycosyltransferase involved in cell wall biosynthesis